MICYLAIARKELWRDASADIFRAFAAADAK
jgi:hypothetical protein